jgi:hypothetical protein
MALVLKNLRNNAKHLDRLNWNTQATLAAMKRGESLHLHHSRQGPVWYLSGGRIVPLDVAKTVTANQSVADVGDTLFRNATSQTFRWIEM